MRQTRPFRPTLESLEDRAVPATVVVSGGNLEVSGQVGTLVVETTAIAGLLRVTDDTGTVRASGVTGRVRITGDGLGNVIRIAANAGSKLALPGVLVVNAGNGNDQVFLSGKVNGNVRINTGLGNDLVTSDDAAVRIGGSLSLFDEAGANTFSMNGVNYKVARDATFTGLGTFQTGAGNTLSVGGTLTMTANTFTPLDITLGGASAVVGGDLVVSGGEAGDVLRVTTNFRLGGDLAFDAGNGSNTAFLNPTAGGIVGDFLFTGGSGADAVVFWTNSQIGGDTSIDFGSGINEFTDTSTSQFNGDLSVTGGTELAVTENTNRIAVRGQIGGSLSVAFAGGRENTTVLIGSVGQQVVYRGGLNSTSEALTLLPTAAAVIDIDAQFGEGSSTFTIGSTVSLTGVVTGMDNGTYSFFVWDAILLPSLQLINYP